MCILILPGGGVMAEEFKAGCQRPKPKAIKPEAVPETTTTNEPVREEQRMIKVGAPAPDFELPAYHEGVFKTFTLSEFKGKWVVLCFYPGDFTFV